MNLTPTLDRKHGGALVRDWRDLLQTFMRSRRLTCRSFVRLGDYERAFSTLGNIPRKPINSEIGLTNASTAVRAVWGVGRYRHQLHPLEAF
jgi:hypothetical protein